MNAVIYTVIKWQPPPPSYQTPSHPWPPCFALRLLSLREFEICSSNPHTSIDFNSRRIEEDRGSAYFRGQIWLILWWEGEREEAQLVLPCSTFLEFLPGQFSPWSSPKAHSCKSAGCRCVGESKLYCPLFTPIPLQIKKTDDSLQTILSTDSHVHDYNE
jgi:hypothetical protein